MGKTVEKMKPDNEDHLWYEDEGVASWVAAGKKTGMAARLQGKNKKLPFVTDLAVEEVSKPVGWWRKVERYLHLPRCKVSWQLEEHCVVEKEMCSGA